MLNRLIASALVVVFAATSLAQPASRKPTKKEEQPAPPPRQPQPTRGRPAPVHADDITLKIGDPAPAIFATNWIKGEPVTAFEEGQVYLVEFWGTHCGPCIANIPHLSSLQRQYRNLTVIGVAASEKLEYVKERRRKEAGAADPILHNLQKFVEEKGRRMEYTVAYDSTGFMKKLWLTAAGQQFIPTAFVVDGYGEVSWLGLAHKKTVEDEVRKAVKKAPPKKRTDKAKREQGKKDEKKGVTKDSRKDAKRDSVKDSDKDQKKDSKKESGHEDDWMKDDGKNRDAKRR
jgi:thiol-disulfide isomerase/thioredoxin